VTADTILDTIFLHGLKCHCVIGVWEWEKRITQTLVLDIDLGTDIRQSAKTDKLQDTLNYKKIAERVIEFAESSRFDLIETLIEKIAALIIDEFDVAWLRIKLDKGGAVKNVGNVGIVIERTK